MNAILALEDESSVMKLMRYLLKRYTVLEASTAKEALWLFKDNNRRIGLLIADVTLPLASGIQVALLLRLENPALPVVLTSGYPLSGWSERDAADLERLGSDTVTILQKPFQPQLLLNSVHELIGAPQPEIATTA